MTDTISGTHTQLLALDPESGNPATIVSSATLSDGLAMAYTGLTLINAGSIVIPGTLGSNGSYTMPAAVIMADSGIVTNQSGGVISGLGWTTQTGKTWGLGSYADTTVTVVNAGLITGGAYAIHLGGSGDVTNQLGGTLSGYQAVVAAANAATVLNAGIIAGNSHASGGAGVLLSAGGSVTNQSGGTISGYHAVAGAGAALTVVNDGTIATDDTGLNASTAVFLAAGGAVTNASTAAIIGEYGIEGVSAAVTVVNAGQIDGGLRGVLLHAGGSVTNQTGGTISGAVLGYVDATTVVNAGKIAGSPSGVYLGAGGAVTNQTGGTISGNNAIVSNTGPLTVDNAGAIIGVSNGILFQDGGNLTNRSSGTIIGGVYADVAAVTVANAGTIATYQGGTGDAGVLLQAGGSVTNQSGGTILGDSGIAIYNFAEPVVNAGDIAGGTVTNSNNSGVLLAVGGSVTNQTGGTISGYFGVNIETGGATLANAGTIAGYSGALVRSGSRRPGGHSYYSDYTYTAVGSAAAGVAFGAGGSVTNDSRATISGYRAVEGVAGPMTVVNSGIVLGSSTVPTLTLDITTTDYDAFSYTLVSAATFKGSGGAGVFFGDGGSLTNQIGGTISGYRGVAAYNDAVAVVNDGSIAGSDFVDVVASRVVAQSEIVVGRYADLNRFCYGLRNRQQSRRRRFFGCGRQRHQSDQRHDQRVSWHRGLRRRHDGGE